MVTILSYTLKHKYIRTLNRNLNCILKRLAGDQFIEDPIVTTDGMLNLFNTVACW